MTINKYIGSRYVPLYIGVHDENKSYEPLSIVSNEAKTKTYTSKQAVPVGVSIDNEDYWAQSGYFQDGIVDIHPDIYEVASYDQPTFTVTKGEEEAELKLEVADSYSAGDSFGEAYVLNTLTQAGLYIIKPSACVEVPKAIAEVETPVSLSVILYNVDNNPCYMQQIVSDNAIYVRHCDSETVWGDWQEISGGGGSYTLPVASTTKLGGVKIGENVNISSDGTISVTKGSIDIASATTLGGVKIGDNINVTDDGTISVSSSAGVYTAGNGIIIDNGVISAHLPTRGQSSYAPVSYMSPELAPYNGLIVFCDDGIIADYLFGNEKYYGLKLRVATKDKIGGVKIGDGLAVTSDGTISVTGSTDSWVSGTGSCDYGTVTYKQYGKNVQVTFTLNQTWSGSGTGVSIASFGITGIPAAIANSVVAVSRGFTTGSYAANFDGRCTVATRGAADNFAFCGYGNTTPSFSSGDVLYFSYLAA